MPLIPGKQIAHGSNGIKAVNVDDTEIATLAGTNVFTGDVEVPTPTTSSQAANKSYVDAQVAIPTFLNKQQPTLATTTDGDLATNTAVGQTPIGGYVDVRIDGLSEDVGDGVKTNSCYFSDDSGATAKNISAITVGDKLYWNGSIAGYQLSTGDFVDFFYDVNDGSARFTAGGVQVQTSDYTVVPSDSTKIFTNEGASGQVIFSLPPAAANLIYEFIVMAAHNLRILAAGSNIIRLGAVTTSSGGNMEVAVVGDSVRLVCVNSSTWVMTSLNGDWTVN